jgi:hypothetical protein
MKIATAYLLSILAFVMVLGFGYAEPPQSGGGKKTAGRQTPVDSEKVTEARVRLALTYTEDSFVEVLIRDKKVLSKEILVPLKKAKIDPQPGAYIVVGLLSVKRKDGSVIHYHLYSPWGNFSDAQGKYYIADFRSLLETLRKAMRDVAHSYPIRAEEGSGS